MKVKNFGEKSKNFNKGIQITNKMDTSIT